MKAKTKNLVRSRAFSLVELLTVVASIAVIGAVAVAYISSSNQSLTASKLEQDVSQLNSAVKVFTTSGGRIDPELVTTEQEVLTELKKAASNPDSNIGLSGSLIDNRLAVVHDTDGELRDRAVWKEKLGKFVIERSKKGVREFVLDETLANVDFGTAARDTKLVYNDSDGWVWETVDYEAYVNTGPSDLPTLNAPTLGASTGTGSANSAKLGQPIISPGSAVLALNAYPLQVSIAAQPSDPQGSTIFYSTESGVWVAYDGPFEVEPGTSIQAFSSIQGTLWEDSDPTTATYGNDPETLSIALNIPKNPITYAEAGGSLESGNYTPPADLAPITVSLPSASRIPDQYENSDNFRVFWTYDGSDPRSSSSRHSGTSFSNGYPGDSINYDLEHWDGASLLPIQIIAQSDNPSVVTNSTVLSANIGIRRTNLRAPQIAFESDTSRGDMVELTKLTDFGDMPTGSRIYYTTDGTDPGDDGNGNPETGTLYTGAFDPLNGRDLDTEAVISARVYPPSEYAAWFNVSPVLSTDYTVPEWEISGNASGWFSNAKGGRSLVSNIRNNQTNNYFQWGNPGNWGTGANWLYFSGSAFEDVTSDERFQIGQLSYYNGTIYTSTAATGIDFTVELEFSGAAAQFDYGFDLLTTPNNGNAWQNADYVWFNDTQSAQTVNLYGVDYSLNLEFGETSSYGFSSIDQFHVQEAQSASANLYATLVSVGSWW